MTLVGIVPRDSLVLDELDLRLLLFLLVIINAARIAEMAVLKMSKEITYTGLIMTLMLPCVNRSMCVTNSVLKTQLMIGSPSSVGPKLRAWTTTESSVLITTIF